MSSAVLDTMTVILLAGEVTFSAAGSKVKFPGFMKIYVEGNDDGTTEEEKFLPALAAGDEAADGIDGAQAAFYAAAAALSQRRGLCVRLRSSE